MKIMGKIKQNQVTYTSSDNSKETKTMKTIKLIILLAFTAITSSLWAQQDSQYTQYMYNTIAVNPAYAGSRGVMSIGALHRSQWIGLSGAPTTQTVNIHAPLGNRVGAGLSIVNDKIGDGVNQETYFDGVFSYTIPTSRSRKLSFGLKVGGHSLNIDLNKLQAYRSDLNYSGQESVSNFNFNFGAGAYYHTNRFYLGLSAPNFLNSKHFDNNGTDETFLAEERLNMYLISGYVFDLNTFLKLKPATLIKAVNGAPLQIDLSATMLYNDKFSFGIAYRWDAALSGLVGFQVSDQLYLGVAYDKETTELGNTSFNNGSFEVLLRYEFLSKFKKVKSSRFF